MTWGNVSKFAEIVNDNKTLQDLSYGRTENEDYIIWKKGDNSPRIPKIDYGFKMMSRLPGITLWLQLCGF